MSDAGAVHARASRYLPQHDPATVWSLVGDPSRLGEWSLLRDVQWDGDLLRHGDRFAARIRLFARAVPVVCTVRDWEAGRRYRLRVEGQGRVMPLHLECRVESLVEEGHPVAQVELRANAAGGGTLLRVLLRRRLRAALRRIEGRLR